MDPLSIILGVAAVVSILTVTPIVAQGIADAIATARASKAGEWDLIDKERDRKAARSAKRAAVLAGRRRARNVAAGGDGVYQPGIWGYCGEAYRAAAARMHVRARSNRALKDPHLFDPNNPDWRSRIDQAVRDRVGQARPAGRHSADRDTGEPVTPVDPPRDDAGPTRAPDPDPRSGVAGPAVSAGWNQPTDELDQQPPTAQPEPAGSAPTPQASDDDLPVIWRTTPATTGDPHPMRGSVDDGKCVVCFVGDRYTGTASLCSTCGGTYCAHCGANPDVHGCRTARGTATEFQQGGTMSSPVSVAEVTSNEALRHNFQQMSTAAAKLADALAVAEAARNEIAALSRASQDGVGAKRFDQGATAAANDVADNVDVATLSDWSGLADNVKAAADSGARALDKYIDSEALVASEGVDASTLESVAA